MKKLCITNMNTLRISISIFICLYFVVFLLQETLCKQSQKTQFIEEGELRKLAVKTISPRYPPISSAAEITGPVEVSIVVSGRGEVISAKAIKGNSLLRDAAIEAASGWKFKPMRGNSETGEAKAVLTFDFKLPKSFDLDLSIEKSKAITKSSLTSAEAYYQLGKLQYKRLNYSGAIEAYRKAAQLKGDLYTVFYDLGEIYFRQNEFDQAIKAYKMALKLKPSYVEARWGVGWSQIRLHNYIEAIETFSQTIKIRDDVDITYRAYLNIALAYEALGNIEEAVIANQQVVASAQELLQVSPIYPVMPDVFARKSAQLYEKIGRKEEAVSSYKRAAELASNEMEKYWALIGLGRLLEEVKKNDDAILVYQEALQYVPRSAKPHLALGRLYLIKKNKEAAFREYDVLKSLDALMATELLAEIKKLYP